MIKKTTLPALLFFLSLGAQASEKCENKVVAKSIKATLDYLVDENITIANKRIFSSRTELNVKGEVNSKGISVDKYTTTVTVIEENGEVATRYTVGQSVDFDNSNQSCKISKDIDTEIELEN